MAMVLGAFTMVSAQGGAGVITLAMPPPGGDGHSALQSGTAMATGVASAWHNPALLANLGKTTGSYIHFATARQDLVGDDGQRFSGAAVVYPGLGTDLGIAVYRNTTDFGVVLPDQSRAEESVYGLAAGVGLSRFLSLGLAAKYYRSDMGAARADGWAFDVGMAASKRYRPIGEIPAFEVMPSAGIALRNLGSDAEYADPEASDPLPRTWSNGLGVQVDHADIVQITLAYDLERPVPRRAQWNDPWTQRYGYTASVFGFRFGHSWLRDPGGELFERHVMQEYEFNFQRVMKVLTRLAEGDFTRASTEEVAVLPGTKLRINPRFVVGRREIASGRREGWDATYFSVSL